MVKWIIEDDCLAPSGKLKIEYSGISPFGVCQKIPEILMKTWQVTSVDLWEREFSWDIMEDPRKFYIRIYVNKAADSRSKIFTEVILQGTQPTDPTKEGKLTIFLSARLKTEFERKSVFQRLPIYKGLLWLYNKVFYGEVRRGYLRLCQNLLEKTVGEFKTLLSLPAT